MKIEDVTASKFLATLRENEAFEIAILRLARSVKKQNELAAKCGLLPVSAEIVRKCADKLIEKYCVGAGPEQLVRKDNIINMWSYYAKKKN